MRVSLGSLCYNVKKMSLKLGLLPNTSKILPRQACVTIYNLIILYCHYLTTVVLLYRPILANCVCHLMVVFYSPI